MATREDVIAELKRRGYQGEIPAQKTPQDDSNSQIDIQSLLRRAQPSAGQSIANAMSVLGGGKPIYEQGGGDYEKLYAQEMIKKQLSKGDDELQRRNIESQIESRKTMADARKQGDLLFGGYQEDGSPIWITPPDNRRVKNVSPGLTNPYQERAVAQSDLANRQADVMGQFFNKDGPGGMITPEATIGGIKFVDPEQTRKVQSLEAEGVSREEQMKGAQKLSRAVRRLSILNQQFNEALPTGDRSAFQQRIAGPLAVIGAKTGISPNPRLMALKSNIRPIAINLIRDFGEVGNLSETEQRGAIDAVTKEGLTDEERIAQTGQFIQYALGGIPKETRDFLLQSSDIKQILDDFGIQFDDETQIGGQINSGQTRSGNKFKRIS